MTVTQLAVDAIACYRLTRLATADTITHRPRDRIVEAAYTAAGRAEAERPTDPIPGAWSEVAMDDPDPPWLAALVTCRFCTSIWLAAGVVAARRLAPRVWQPVAELLTFSAAAVLLANLEDG